MGQNYSSINELTNIPFCDLSGIEEGHYAYGKSVEHVFVLQLSPPMWIIETAS